MTGHGRTHPTGADDRGAAGILRIGLAVVVVAAVSACAGTPDVARDRVAAASAAHPATIGDDDNPTRQLPPGRYVTTVEATWSNRARDRTRLSFDADAGTVYRARAFEANQATVSVRLVDVEPDAPPASKSKEMEFAEAMGWALLGGAVQGLLPLIIMAAPVWFPIYLAAQRPSARPSPDCCFVWIEEAQSRRVVAGFSPMDKEAVAAISQSVDARLDPQAAGGGESPAPGAAGQPAIWNANESRVVRGRLIVLHEGLVFLESLPSGGESPYRVNYAEARSVTLTAARHGPQACVHRSDGSAECFSIVEAGGYAVDVEATRELYAHIVREARGDR